MPARHSQTAKNDLAMHTEAKGTIPGGPSETRVKPVLQVAQTG